MGFFDIVKEKSQRVGAEVRFRKARAEWKAQKRRVGKAKKVLPSLLEKQQKRELKEFKASEKREKKEEARKRKLEKIKRETEYYSALGERRRAKLGMRAKPSPLRKKKRGKKLSRKIGMRLM